MVINDKTIKIYSDTDEAVVTVILNSEEDTDKIWQICKQIGVEPFNLVCITGFNWNRDLSPWPAEPIFKNGNSFEGKADQYLDEIVNEIIPKLKLNSSCYVIAGYSLAGLFALYSAYNTDVFSAVVSASGSLWYEDFMDYCLLHDMKNIKRVYLSLGDKEAQTKNKIMATVDEIHIELQRHLSKTMDCIYEINEGNHFTDPELRIAKGIKYTVNNLE